MHHYRTGRTVHTFCLVIRILTAALTAGVLVFSGIFTIPRLFGIEPFIVKSGSMEPAIRTGSVAFVDTRQDEVERGDIIAFRISGATGNAETVTHRVVGVTEGGWITKGDANDTHDSQPVRADQIIGKYILSIPEIGYYLDGRLKETVFLLILWVAAANMVSAMLTHVLDPGRDRSGQRSDQQQAAQREIQERDAYRDGYSRDLRRTDVTYRRQQDAWR